MSDLNPEAKLAIREETRKSVMQVVAIFGVANLAVVLAALWSFWSFGQNQISGITEQVKEDVFANLTTTREELNDAVAQANQLIGRLQERSVELDDIDERLERIKIRLDILDNDEMVTGASNFIEAWQGVEDLDELVTSIDQLITLDPALGCENPRVYSGVTPKQNLVWVEYGAPNRANVEIDTSQAGFSRAPLYFASLEGSGSWSAQGVSAIYDRQSDKFRIYLKWSPTSNDHIIPYGQQHWDIHWLGIGC